MLWSLNLSPPPLSRCFSSFTSISINHASEFGTMYCGVVTAFVFLKCLQFEPQTLQKVCLQHIHQFSMYLSQMHKAAINLPSLHERTELKQKPKKVSCVKELKQKPNFVGTELFSIGCYVHLLMGRWSDKRGQDVLFIFYSEDTFLKPCLTIQCAQWQTGNKPNTFRIPGHLTTLGLSVADRMEWTSLCLFHSILRQTLQVSERLTQWSKSQERRINLVSFVKCQNWKKNDLGIFSGCTLQLYRLRRC